jgi:hypothetical protein
MIAVVKGQLALYVFNDDENVVLTPNGLISPILVGDINSDNAEIVNIDAPAKFVPGGVMSIVNGEWVINDQAAYDAYEEPTPDVTYKILTKNEAFARLMIDGGMTKAEIVAANKDEELAFEWMMWDAAKPDDINRNSSNTMAVLIALRDATAQYITQAELEAIMANWPTVNGE